MFSFIIVLVAIIVVAHFSEGELTYTKRDRRTCHHFTMVPMTTQQSPTTTELPSAAFFEKNDGEPLLCLSIAEVSSSSRDSSAYRWLRRQRLGV
jgi:hypothetical protein